MSGTPDHLPALTPDKVIAYLKHLGVDDDRLNKEELPLPTYELLCQIQKKHYWKVPFESISVHIPYDTSKVQDNDPIPFQKNLSKALIDPGPLIDKIVTRSRGGYCFELNGLVAMALRTLGYTITNGCARVYIHQKKDPEVAGWAWFSTSHQVTIVTIGDERYHVDVGFGEGQPETPLLLGSETSDHLMKRERLPPWPQDDEMTPLGYTLYRKLDGIYSPMYHYADQRVLPSEYFSSNWFNCTFPEAPFVERMVCTLPVQGGRKNIIYAGDEKEGAKYYMKRNGVDEEVEYLKTFGELKACLARHFAISL